MTGLRTAAAVLVLGSTLTACGPGGSGAPADPGAPAPRVAVTPAAAGRAQPSLPTRRAKPQYLTRSYRAPASAERRHRAGTLRIPALGISAPVDAVGLDRGVMAIPDSPSRVGWLRTTAARGDRIGASVLSGHVSDSHDVPGALSRLRAVRRGAVITWTGPRGDRHRFVVTGTRRYPRARGVPARLFGVTGPHVLHLITCADRVRTPGGGFHYTANLVVTARALP